MTWLTAVPLKQMDRYLSWGDTERNRATIYAKHLPEVYSWLTLLHSRAKVSSDNARLDIVQRMLEPDPRQRPSAVRIRRMLHQADRNASNDALSKRTSSSSRACHGKTSAEVCPQNRGQFDSMSQVARQVATAVTPTLVDSICTGFLHSASPQKFGLSFTKSDIRWPRSGAELVERQIFYAATGRVYVLLHVDSTRRWYDCLCIVQEIKMPAAAKLAASIVKGDSVDGTNLLSACKRGYHLRIEVSLTSTNRQLK